MILLELFLLFSEEIWLTGTADNQRFLISIVTMGLSIIPAELAIRAHKYVTNIERRLLKLEGQLKPLQVLRDQQKIKPEQKNQFNQLEQQYDNLADQIQVEHWFVKNERINKIKH